LFTQFQADGEIANFRANRVIYLKLFFYLARGKPSKKLYFMAALWDARSLKTP